MSQTTLLRIPDAKSQIDLYSRYFDEEGVSESSVLEAVSLTHKRSDVFNDDAIAVFEERGVFRSACKAGCGYCCHTQVSVLPPEAFHIARHIATAFRPDARAALVEKVRAHDARYRNVDGAARYAGRASCPFLDTKSWYCGLHAGRPTACRAMHSGSLPACVTAYERRDPNAPAPSMKAFFENRDATYVGISTALAARGLSMRPVEMNAALVTIWDGPDTMGRWLAGEDVFSGL